MLDELRVNNIALIDETSLTFSGGLTVLTGETGAGKTALLNALRLISGQRADAHAVRSGAKEASVQARLILGDQEHVVSRRLSAQGRSRCTLDGDMATVGQLSQAASSISIHNQHDQVKLLQPAAQLAYLDDAISPDGLHLQAYRKALAAYRQACDELSRVQQAAQTEQAQLDYYSFVVAQVEEVHPQEGEYESYAEELPRMQHAEALSQAARGLYEAINSDGAALDLLSSALAATTRQAGIDAKLDALVSQAESACDDLSELAHDLRAYCDSIQFDPYALQQANERMGALQGLMRRWGPDMEQVFKTYDEAKAALDNAQASPQRIQSLKDRCEACRKALVKEGNALTQQREQGAEKLCSLLAATVSDLSMPDARFSFSFEPLELGQWGEKGPDRVELRYAPGSAMELQPLSRIASGGELSRVLLALECIRQVQGGSDRDATLVFDEIDTGIGGATGQAVARRLKQLSRDAQVIVVTHLAQVAACADAHYVVTKRIDADGMPETTIQAVEGERRTAEIARMLAGGCDDVALDHARSLIAEARGY